MGLLLVLLSCLLATSTGFMFYYRHQAKNLWRKNQLLSEQLTKQERARQLLEAQTLEAIFSGLEIERKRISADIHDEVGASLSALKINLDSLQKTLVSTVRQYDLFADVFKGIDEVIRRNREIIWGISPMNLERFGLSAALQQIVNRLNNSHTTRADFEVEGTQPSDVSMDAQLAVYRIVQELVINAAKHSNAWRVSVKLVWQPDLLMAYVEDNGIGIPEYKEMHGMGLQNIRNRLILLRGTLELEKRYRGGMFVITIPLSSLREGSKLPA